MTRDETKLVYETAFAHAIRTRYRGGFDAVEGALWLMEIERQLGDAVPEDYYETGKEVIKDAIFTAQERVNQFLCELCDAAPSVAEGYCRYEYDKEE